MESTMPREARDGMTVVELYWAHRLELVRLAVLLLGDRLAAEDAVAATLRAEAMTVTEESLRPAELPTRPQHRRMVPALIATAAAAAVAAAIVGAVAIASGPERESPPAHTTTALPPVTSSTPAPTVVTSPPVEPVCGNQKCHLVQSVRIGADYLGDSDTSLGIARNGSGWHFTGAQFDTPFGAHRLDVRDLGGNGSLEVVSVEEKLLDEGQSQWSACVWRWDGTKLGCAPQVAVKEELPGWPEVRPDLSTVEPKNCPW